MIKNFEEYINEDYFSKLANRKDNGSVRRENEITEDDVMDIIHSTFKNDIESISFRKENNKTLVDVRCRTFVLRDDIEEIPFQFGKVTGNFSCEDCIYLSSLHGCPESVTGFFDCSGCESLESLDGCPKEVGGEFYCHDCDTEFSIIDVKSRCNVSGDIVV